VSDLQPLQPASYRTSLSLEVYPQGPAISAHSSCPLHSKNEKMECHWKTGQSCRRSGLFSDLKCFFLGSYGASRVAPTAYRENAQQVFFPPTWYVSSLTRRSYFLRPFTDSVFFFCSPSSSNSSSRIWGD
jgi:hypothetical protein